MSFILLEKPHKPVCSNLNHSGLRAVIVKVHVWRLMYNTLCACFPQILQLGITVDQAVIKLGWSENSVWLSVCLVRFLFTRCNTIALFLITQNFHRDVVTRDYKVWGLIQQELLLLQSAALFPFLLSVKTVQVNLNQKQFNFRYFNTSIICQ